MRGFWPASSLRGNCEHLFANGRFHLAEFRVRVFDDEWLPKGPDLGVCFVLIDLDRRFALPEADHNYLGRFRLGLQRDQVNDFILVENRQDLLLQRLEEFLLLARFDRDFEKGANMKQIPRSSKVIPN